MKVYQAAKKLGIPNKEFLKEYGLKHHMNEIPVELEAELFGEEKKNKTEPQATKTVDSAETIVVGEENEKNKSKCETATNIIEVNTGSGVLASVDAVIPSIRNRPNAKSPEQEDCPYTIKEIELGIRCLGGRSKQWKWRHLLNG